MNTFEKEGSLWANTLGTFKTLIGYDLSTLRVVFEHGGDEVVFINEVLIGRVKIYLNGNLAYSGWDWTLMVRASGWFLHKGKTYKIVSKISNLFSYAQNISLSIDDELIETKADAFYGKRSFKEILHVAFGVAVLGFILIGFIELFLV